MISLKWSWTFLAPPTVTLTHLDIPSLARTKSSFISAKDVSVLLTDIAVAPVRVWLRRMFCYHLLFVGQADELSRLGENLLIESPCLPGKKWATQSKREQIVSSGIPWFLSFAAPPFFRMSRSAVQNSTCWSGVPKNSDISRALDTVFEPIFAIGPSGMYDIKMGLHW